MIRLFLQLARKALRLLVLLGLVATVACNQTQKTKSQQVIIFGLEDRASSAHKGVKFDIEQTQSVLKDAITESRQLELVDQENQDAFRVEMIITLASERESTHPDETGVYRAVQVDLTLFKWLSDHEKEKLTAQGKAFLVQDPKEVERQEGFEQVLLLAIKQAVELVDLQFETRRLPGERLKQLLKSERAEDRLYVLRTLRDRHEPKLVPNVVEMLFDSDTEVAMEAVGVLVAQKDQRAVPGLIRMAQGRDPIFLLQIITALSEIRGPVARGYLFTLAAGHDSAEIRKQASTVLKRFEQQQKTDTKKPEGKAVAFPRQQQPKDKNPAK
ncbi:MAG: HEAT repeat domain-containing protein [Deltaproteobacteria bacterium]|nr:HEAT repeat domain-containing protein [Deltaproteobacteria bacterium]MBW1870440.1 HEAT repeat domain-containing protein [Deltaproteobacteria bacterium]